MLTTIRYIVHVNVLAVDIEMYYSLEGLPNFSQTIYEFMRMGYRPIKHK